MRAVFMGDPIEDESAFARLQGHLLTREFGANPDYWLDLSPEDFALAWEHYRLIEGRRNPKG